MCNLTKEERFNHFNHKWNALLPLLCHLDLCLLNLWPIPKCNANAWSQGVTKFRNLHCHLPNNHMGMFSTDLMEGPTTKTIELFFISREGRSQPLHRLKEIMSYKCGNKKKRRWAYSRRLWRDIIRDAINPYHLVGNSGGNTPQNFWREGEPKKHQAILSRPNVIRQGHQAYQSAVMKSSDCTARRAMT